MTGDRAFRTGSGIARVRGGDLVVERSTRAFLAGWYDRNVASASRARAAWNLLRPSLAAGTVWQFGPMVRDGVQPGGLEYLAVVVVALLPVALAVQFHREGVRTTTVPLDDVDRAVVDPSERTVALHHGGETDVDLRGDDDVAAAREHLRMRGVEVIDAGSDPSRDEGGKPWRVEEYGMPRAGDDEDLPSQGEGERRQRGGEGERASAQADGESTPDKDDTARSSDVAGELATSGRR